MFDMLMANSLVSSGMRTLLSVMTQEPCSRSSVNMATPSPTVSPWSVTGSRASAVGITANTELLRARVEDSIGLVTALNPYIGYENATRIARVALETGRGVLELVREVKSMGMETCMTLGMLTPPQVARLKEAGLDFYNHNIDTSPAYYPKIATTRTMEDRLDTLDHVRQGGIKVCCGGILGMGEAEEDRIAMLVVLANLSHHPESVPINLWQPIGNTPVEAMARPVDPFALVRAVALARILMPQSVVRLSAGRMGMSDELQALCFLAGANSIFAGDVLLTTENPASWQDADLFARLGMRNAVVEKKPVCLAQVS